MFSPALLSLAKAVLDAARAKKLRIATAESCTGGLISGVLTEIPRSSDVLERGFVTYSNKAKEEMLGVPPALIKHHGAVSEQVARAMAEGAIKHSPAHLAVAVTGIAGPGGGTKAKPVGLVYLAVHRKGRPSLNEEHRFGNIGRTQVRLKSVEAALELLRRLL